jgi:hypothetical protein
MWQFDALILAEAFIAAQMGSGTHLQDVMAY